jgi:hypothetical protein
MAIDIEAIKKKFGALSGNNKRGNMNWKPKEGEEYTIRLLSFPNNDGQPFKDFWFYYNIGNNPGLLAPYQFGKPDPIQELINKLREDGSKESYELAKKLYAKMRCYAPVIVRGEEDKGVQIWSFGKQVYQTLLGIILDEDYGDITDPYDGRDVRITCTRPAGKKFAETAVMPKGKSSALHTNAAQAKKWVDSVPDPNTMFETKSYDELSKIVNDWIAGGAESGDGTEKGGKAPASSDDDAPRTTRDRAPSKEHRSLDDAFSDLMDD